MADAIVILGPTASGKSNLALELSEHIDCEIISLDSALIYKGMDIGTAKPSKQELAQCVHHLIDICDPIEKYSAANFFNDCNTLIDKIKKKNKIPIICGGTMMYYNALKNGINDIPSTKDEIRAQVYEQAQEHGWPYLHSLLQKIDPLCYEKYSPNDKQRISRALEVYYQTGKSLSSYYQSPKLKSHYSFDEYIILPQIDRVDLRELIIKRFNNMLDQGFIKEVEALKNRGDLSLDLPSMRSVGYRQIWEYLDGQYDYKTMFEKSIIATARLAKHQMTWLRSLKLNLNEILKPQDPKNCKIILDNLNK